MKKTLFICIGVLICIRTFSQGIDPHIDFGEGLVTIVEYGVPPPPERPVAEKLEPQAILNYSSNLSFAYYIKKNKVLLRAQDSGDQKITSSSNTTNLENGKTVAASLSVKFMHPTYLIDCVKRTVCFISDSTNQLVEKSLEETSTEWFYKNVNSVLPKQDTIISLLDSRETIIAGKKCHKGLVRDYDGKTFPFYYCKDPIGVRSPLNNFFPGTFPYNILRCDFPIKWSFMDGTVSNDGLMIFQVSEIKTLAIPDSIMIPPKNLVPVN